MTTNALKGNEFLVKFATTYNGVDYTAVAAPRTNSVTINNGSVDITNKDGNGWQELMAGGGVKSMSATCDGVYSNAATQNIVISAILASTAWAVQIVDGAGNTFTGNFHVSNLSFGGDQNAEETYSFTIDSADEITFVEA